MACFGDNNVSAHVEKLNKSHVFSNFHYVDYLQEEVGAEALFEPHTDFRIFCKPFVKYKPHPLQSYFNKQRHFDVNDHLYSLMFTHGSSVFYQYVCGHPAAEKSSAADLTTIQSLATISKAADYLFSEVHRLKGEEPASLAKLSYMRGFSRPVQANSRDDCNKLRDQLRDNDPAATIVRDDGSLRFQDESILPIALSYKGSSVKISRRMLILDDDGNPKKDEGLAALGQGDGETTRAPGFDAQESIKLTADFVDDFRWDQVRRSCAQIARLSGKQYVSVWVDRLVMWGLGNAERQQRYNLLKWEDFGLMPYALCPVVRVYEINETDFGTDFWRKLETAMGVAGCGLFLDDYMLRHYDESIYFRPELYSELPSGDGICKLGGGNRFVRSISLALATAILTDTISVHSSNEDKRSVESVMYWKAWALRTIGDGAYKKEQPMMLTQQPAYVIGQREFETIAFWEAYVSHSQYLQGNGYLDMSIPQSFQYYACRTWNGIHEWLGMVSGSFRLNDETKCSIREFLNANVDVEAWTSTTRHVAVLLRMMHPQHVGYSRTLTVGLSRFSTTTQGQVISLAESTGLWDTEKLMLPKRFVFILNPEEDQKAEVKNGQLRIVYNRLKQGYRRNLWGKRIGLIIVMVSIFVATFIFVDAEVYSMAAILGGLLLVTLFVTFVSPGLWYRKIASDAVTTNARYSTGCCLSRRRIWAGSIGEVVFDNLRMHGMFNSGIKENEYRRMRTAAYADLQWT